MYTYRPSAKAISGNPIWHFLETAQVPWLVTVNELAQSSRTVLDPITSEPAIELHNTSKLMRDMYKPLRISAHAHDRYALPHSLLWGIYKKNNLDPVSQYEEIKSAFLGFFGAGRDSSASNTFSYTWSYWPAELTLTIWPNKLNSDCSRAWDDSARDEACYLYIHPGIVPIVSDNELHSFQHSAALGLPRVNTMEVIGVSSSSKAQPLTHLSPRRYWRRIDEVVNDSITRSFVNNNCLGMRISADGQYLFQGAFGGMRCLARQSIKAIVVERTKPGRGPGYSSLGIELINPDAGRQKLFADVCRATGTDDLNKLGRSLAKIIGCELILKPYLRSC